MKRANRFRTDGRTDRVYLGLTTFGDGRRPQRGITQVGITHYASVKKRRLTGGRRTQLFISPFVQ